VHLAETLSQEILPQEAASWISSILKSNEVHHSSVPRRIEKMRCQLNASWRIRFHSPRFVALREFTGDCHICSNFPFRMEILMAGFLFLPKTLWVVLTRRFGRSLLILTEVRSHFLQHCAIPWSRLQQISLILTVYNLFFILVIFQVLTAASMKMTVFWDVAPCSLVDNGRRFRGTYFIIRAMMMELCLRFPIHLHVIVLS
jgi:hypothetical protein